MFEVAVKGDEIYDETYWYQWLVERAHEFKDELIERFLLVVEKVLVNWKNPVKGRTCC